MIDPRDPIDWWENWQRLALLGLVFVSLTLNTVGIRWGLPNGNQTWAADSLQPMTPMAVGRHVLFGDHWNSGWFYFKYPVGHPMLVLATQTPFLALSWLGGELRHPSPKYPYGFDEPEQSLMTLAVLNRLLSALMGVGVVALAYVTGVMLFNRAAGLVAAVCAAGCYPLVFYAHTSNVDMPLLFWIALAFAAAIWSGLRNSSTASVVLGAAAAMALLTKEQSIGALVALPLVWLLSRQGSSAWSVRALAVHMGLALLAFLVTTLVVGNVLWNPSGYVNRWRFLLGTLPREVREKYAPYQFMVQVPKQFSLNGEVQKLAKVASAVMQGLTLPVTIVALAGLVWSALRRPRSVLILLITAATYYVLSLRALELIPVRYVMPLLYLMVLPAGACVAYLLNSVKHARPLLRQIVEVVVAAAVVLSLFPGVEVVRLLENDPRYRAEAWLRDSAAAGTRIEVYQPSTYLPRFDKQWTVSRIPVAERAAPAFAQRQPEYVVMSGGGSAGLTGRYAKNWKPGDPVFSESAAAQQFVEALRAGKLGYRQAAEFRTETFWLRPHINSLNPAITIFARDHAS